MLVGKIGLGQLFGKQGVFNHAVYGRGIYPAIRMRQNNYGGFAFFADQQIRGPNLRIKIIENLDNYEKLKESPNEYEIDKDILSYGVKVYSITQKILKNALIFLPPVPEQEEVIMFLDDKCKMLSCAIEQITREITSLQEMKKRLISDVVTGKIDVREIDIPEYSISLDDIDADMDDEYMEDEIDEEV